MEEYSLQLAAGGTVSAVAPEMLHGWTFVHSNHGHRSRRCSHGHWTTSLKGENWIGKIEYLSRQIAIRLH